MRLVVWAAPHGRVCSDRRLFETRGVDCTYCGRIAQCEQAEFNALRKNQLLAFYETLQPLLKQASAAKRATSKYRDYYFMAMFEVGLLPRSRTHDAEITCDISQRT